MLKGIRVVEVGGLAGSYCGKILADMGADVLRIDDPGHGFDAEALAELSYYHRNKSRRSLDFAHHASRRALHILLAEADVLIDAQTQPDLDHESIGEEHPRLIVAAIRPFGMTGPWSHFKGSDLVCQAAGGMLLLNGEPGRKPLQVAGLQAYHAASLQAATGIVLALLAREHDGRGQRIDVSIQEAVASCVEQATSRFFDEGHIETRRGGLHGNGLFRHARCRDGYVLLSTQGEWTALIEWLKADGAAHDLLAPDWERESYRRQHCEHLFEVLAGWASTYSVQDLVEAAQQRRLPFAPVLSTQELLQNPQLRARGFCLEVPLASTEPCSVIAEPGPAIRFGGSPKHWLPQPPPHTWDDTACRIQVHGNSPDTSQRSPVRGLEGLRVLDLTWVVAGPLATRILADHGAEVLHVERIDTPSRDAWGRRLQRGKKSLAINLNHPRGLELLRQLITQSDVIIDNFSPRVMHNWGLPYAKLSELRADIIAVSMSGFGQDGPWRDYVSYAPTLQALAGFSHAMCSANGEPLGVGFSYSDVAAGWMAAWATILAVWHRQRSGRGQHIDLSQLECLVTLLGPQIRRASRGNLKHESSIAVQAIDNRTQEMPSAPHGVYACAGPSDGSVRERWCALAVFGEKEWTAFSAALGHPAWTREERFCRVADRLRHRAVLDAHIEEWTRQRTAEDVMERLQYHGIAAAVVADARDVCTSWHLRARGFFADASWGSRSMRTQAPSPRLSRTTAKMGVPSPSLGEHTEEVLINRLGISPGEIARLRQTGIIA